MSSSEASEGSGVSADKNVDKLTEELLDLVDRYEVLVNDRLRLNFVDGYLNLSRANFSNHRNFGPDDYDLSGNDACKVVEAGDVFVLRDLLEEQKRKEKENKSKEKKQKQKTEENDTAVASGAKGLASEVRSFNSQKTHNIEEIEQGALKDPIRQFGGIIPYQLRESQKYFSRGLANAVEAVNLQRKITNLVNSIQTLSPPS